MRKFEVLKRDRQVVRIKELFDCKYEPDKDGHFRYQYTEMAYLFVDMDARINKDMKVELSKKMYVGNQTVGSPQHGLDELFDYIFY